MFMENKIIFKLGELMNVRNVTAEDISIVFLKMNYGFLNLKNLSVNQLSNLARDAEYRIGSHSAGGNPVDAYIEKQKTLLSLIQDELSNR